MDPIQVVEIQLRVALLRLLEVNTKMPLGIGLILGGNMGLMLMEMVRKSNASMFKDCEWWSFRFKRHLARTKEDFEPCATVSDEIKLLMMKIVVESKATKEKKRRLNSIDEDEESAEGAEEATNLQGQRGFGPKRKRR